MLKVRQSTINVGHLMCCLRTLLLVSQYITQILSVSTKCNYLHNLEIIFYSVKLALQISWNPGNSHKINRLLDFGAYKHKRK
jgi:hypothetical protein